MKEILERNSTCIVAGCLIFRPCETRHASACEPEAVIRARFQSLTSGSHSGGVAADAVITVGRAFFRVHYKENPLRSRDARDLLSFKNSRST